MNELNEEIAKSQSKDSTISTTISITKQLLKHMECIERLLW